MSMQIVFEQILIIFGYVIAGYVAGKKNLITKEQQRYLSKLVSSLILPFTVLSASSMEASGQDIVNVAIAVALLFSCMALTSAGCMLYAKIKQVPEKKRAAYTGLCTYPNCTFIGMPLCIALMGEWGTLYGAAGIDFPCAFSKTASDSLLKYRRHYNTACADHRRRYACRWKSSSDRDREKSICDLTNQKPDLPAYNVSSDGTSSVRSESKNGSVDLFGVSCSKSDKRICNSARYGTSSLCEGNASVYDFICCNNPIYHLAWTACIWRLNTMLIF